MSVVGVRFDQKSKIYNFDSNNLNLNLGDAVVVSTAKGLQMGTVEATNVVTPNPNLAKVVRLATKEDKENQIQNMEKEKQALKRCREIVEQEKLKMHVVAAKYSFDKKTLTFQFFAEKRVDFRDLLKILASEFRTRIELMQIGVRDKAKEIGGVGPCGQELCCARFLNKLDNVSINMAKNQDLALNPNKINGVCGRLLCCLNYENDHYKECRKNLPKRGTVVSTDKGQGKVIKTDCLSESYSVELNNGEIIEVENRSSK